MQKSFDFTLYEEMRIWHKATLSKLLLLLAVINTVVTTLQFWVISYIPQLWEIVFVISFCILLFVLAFVHTIPHLLKGTFLLFLVYAGIIKQLWMHGLVSTAPITLALIPLMAFLLISPLAGWISGLTFIFLHQSESLSALLTINTGQFDSSVWLEIGFSPIGFIGVLLLIVNQYYRLTLNSEEKYRLLYTAMDQGLAFSIYSECKTYPGENHV
ncbi:MAG: hypothetical protein PF518_12165 [Spirochaetaceae bacterium]|jgi:hypothetical protein|nr:hypothetical protein [Spirochaetaceae bacterium]